MYICTMDGIAGRIGELIEQSGERTASFAKRIGVSQSILSHILHGRNKPSLDLILKIHSALPEIDLEWLLTGEGNNEAQLKNESDGPSVQVTDYDSIKRVLILHANGTFEEFVGK